MAKKAAESPEAAKTRKLRELREADEAKRRAEGIWGALSVAEISHPESKSVFVMRCRGREVPKRQVLLELRSNERDSWGHVVPSVADHPTTPSDATSRHISCGFRATPLH